MDAPVAQVARVFHVGRRVVLRALTAADVEALYPLAHVRQALATYKPGIQADDEGIRAAAQRLEWLAELDPAPEVEALVLHRPSETPIGFITLSCIDPVNAKAELSVALFRARGSRCAAEAVLWTLEHAFGPMALDKLVFLVLDGNAPALRAAQSAGLPLEAVLREEVSAGSGRRDLLRFCLFAREWPASSLRARLQRAAAGAAA